MDDFSLFSSCIIDCVYKNIYDDVYFTVFGMCPKVMVIAAF